MRAKWAFFAMVLCVGVGYIAYPYVTLYRLGLAIRSADTASLESLVNWPTVREGIKEDVCDIVAEQSGPKNSNDLPAFGASFMRGIASSAIDQAVTPQALLAATSTVPASRAAPRGADVQVDWAFFDSPTTFMVSLRAAGQPDPVKLEMDLHHGMWRVQRVWLPSELLSPGSRT